MKHILIVPFAVSAVLIGGCASTPKDVDSLEHARAEVHTLQQDPLAPQAASSELAAARISLGAAEKALQKGKAITKVDHYAYLATQQAQTGRARIAEMRAKEEIAKGEAERNRALLEARTVEAEVAAARAEQESQSADAARLEADVAWQEADAARTDAESAQRELAELQAKQTERGMVLTLSDVLFDTGAATLKPGADLALNRLGAFMATNWETRLVIEGHTDSVGSESYNEDLSQRRAAAVKSALVALGIGSDRIETVGRGESYPVASNDSQAGRQQNRRVEIIFSNESGAFAQAQVSSSDSAVSR